MDESTLFSIKDFSDFTGVNQSTLRYYDEIDLLPAALRGENNYRYYTPFQIIKLNYINVLIDLGVSLSVIKDMNETRTPENVIELLSRQEVVLDRRLYELRMAYSILHTYCKNIQNGLMVQDGMIRVEEFNETHFVLGHENDFNKHDTFYKEFIRFCKSAYRYRINLRFPIGGYHDDINAFLNAPSQPSRFVSLDPMGFHIRPEGSYLVGYKRGYYGDFADMPQKIAGYAQEHNLVFKGPVYVIYLLDEITMTEPSQYLARISVNVSAKNKTHKNVLRFIKRSGTSGYERRQ